MFFEIRFPDCPYTCPGWMNESTPLLKQERWAAESPWRAPLADLLKQDTSSADNIDHKETRCRKKKAFEPTRVEI